MIKKYLQNELAIRVMFAISFILFSGSRFITDSTELSILSILLGSLSLWIVINIEHKFHTNKQLIKYPDSIDGTPKLKFSAILTVLSHFAQYHYMMAGAISCATITTIYQYLITRENLSSVYLALRIKTYTSNLNWLLFPILGMAIMYQYTDELPLPLFSEPSQRIINLNNPKCTIQYNGETIFTSTLKPEEYTKIPAGTYFTGDCLKQS